MITRYTVMWKIDVYADQPIDAAKEAWESMRALNSTANCFEVINQDGVQTNVDLSEQLAQEDSHIMAMAERHGY